MKIVLKLAACLFFLSTLGLSERAVQAVTCYYDWGIYFGDCAGTCDGYEHAQMWACNNVGISYLETECDRYCTELPYPGYSSGWLYSYYQDPLTGEDSGSCQCLF